MLEYNRANREVAILCNHQKTVSKSYEASYAKLEERERLLERQIAELRTMLTDLAGKGGGAGIRLKASHAGDDDDDEEAGAGAGKAAAAKVEASAGAGGPAADAAAAKKAAEKAAAAADSHLFAKTPDAGSVKKRIKVRGGRGFARVRRHRAPKPVPPLPLPVPPPLQAWEDKLATHQAAMRNKDENKAVALGTSKINYSECGGGRQRGRRGGRGRSPLRPTHLPCLRCQWTRASRLRGARRSTCTSRRSSPRPCATSSPGPWSCRRPSASSSVEAPQVQ